MLRGAGTVLNVATVLTGSGIGVLLGNRLPQRTRSVVTDGLGLVTMLVAALSAAAVVDPALSEPQVLAVTATGGLLLVGVALRLLQIKQVPVGDLLPALLVAPVLVEIVMAVR